jgi:hypothetical protein
MHRKYRNGMAKMAAKWRNENVSGGEMAKA